MHSKSNWKRPWGCWTSVLYGSFCCLSVVAGKHGNFWRWQCHVFCLGSKFRNIFQMWLLRWSDLAFYFICTLFLVSFNRSIGSLVQMDVVILKIEQNLQFYLWTLSFYVPVNNFSFHSLFFEFFITSWLRDSQFSQSLFDCGETYPS